MIILDRFLLLRQSVYDRLIICNGCLVLVPLILSRREPIVKISISVKNLRLRLCEGLLHHQLLLRITASMLSENLFLVRLKRGMLIEIKIEVIVDMDVLVVGFVLHVHVVLTFL